MFVGIEVRLDSYGIQERALSVLRYFHGVEGLSFLQRAPDGHSLTVGTEDRRGREVVGLARLKLGHGMVVCICLEESEHGRSHY